MKGVAEQKMFQAGVTGWVMLRALDLEAFTFRP